MITNEVRLTVKGQPKNKKYRVFKVTRVKETGNVEYFGLVPVTKFNKETAPVLIAKHNKTKGWIPGGISEIARITKQEQQSLFAGDFEVLVQHPKKNFYIVFEPCPAK